MVTPEEHNHYMREYEAQMRSGVIHISYLDWLKQFDPANDPNFYENSHIELNGENGDDQS
jgi:hypothetical protein